MAIEQATIHYLLKQGILSCSFLEANISRGSGWSVDVMVGIV